MFAGDEVDAEEKDPEGAAVCLAAVLAVEDGVDDVSTGFSGDEVDTEEKDSEGVAVGSATAVVMEGDGVDVVSFDDVGSFLYAGRGLGRGFGTRGGTMLFVGDDGVDTDEEGAAVSAEGEAAVPFAGDMLSSLLFVHGSRKSKEDAAEAWCRPMKMDRFLSDCCVGI
ncbi:hypothetical protein EST38_g8574 [Candolleomyces aberdarensis]|uniref:Uncharacterized protein n=1 Tax=Candolleomyces aberdarensis TaxID=2316362 RepID=A0A4Q2DCX2_9AGAR|nr:hypothetical protein EST38_g8574 [Candolleomyces aberdarensis]